MERLVLAVRPPSESKRIAFTRNRRGTEDDDDGEEAFRYQSRWVLRSLPLLMMTDLVMYTASGELGPITLASRGHRTRAMQFFFGVGGEAGGGGM